MKPRLSHFPAIMAGQALAACIPPEPECGIVVQSQDPEMWKGFLEKQFPETQKHFILTAPEPMPVLIRPRAHSIIAALCMSAALSASHRERARAFDIPRHKAPPVPRDDAGHLAAAEAKRQRKAAKK